MNLKSTLPTIVQGYIDTLINMMDTEVTYLTTIAGTSDDPKALNEATSMQTGYEAVKSVYALSSSDSICSSSITWDFDEDTSVVLKRETDDSATTASVCSLKTATSTTTTSAAAAASSNFWIYSYSDTTCSSDDEYDSAEGFGSDSLGCVPWSGDAGDMAMKAKFDNSLWEVTVYSGESCDSSNLLYTLESEKCYDLSDISASGAYNVAKAVKDFTIYTYSDTDCKTESGVGDAEGYGTESLGCVTFSGGIDGFKADFDASLYVVTVYTGEACDSSNLLDTVTSGKCYDTSATDSGGAYKIALV